ncbi:hypothetical protein [Nocardia concava]|uniref:hypothetical protein n=1 Tax=Nocardia concava TaxID=257281 RepID=UPI00031FB61C|nr:hypothetical protein [Nocardia concava]
MPSDRPGGPDNTPDRNSPDPAHPSETPTPPTDPAQLVYEHHPLPPYPEELEAAAASGGSEPTSSDTEPASGEAAPPASGNEPTVRFEVPEPGGHQPTLPLPTESATGAGTSGAGGAADTPESPGGIDWAPFSGSAPSYPPPNPSAYQPTLPLPTESGALGEQPGVAGVEPPFTMPVPSLEPEAPPVPAVPPRRGSIVNQEAGITQPRPPTVAEARAREKARKRAEEQAQAEAEAAEAKQRKKKRILIGGAAVVGIAGLVGGGYLVASAWNGPDVTATCTVVAKKGEVVPTGNGQTVTATQDNQEIVVPDNYCSDAQSHGNSGINPGFFFLAGHSYRYYYGGPSQTIGHAPVGGTTVAPKGATIKTKSGSTIQRGGLGARVGGGS